MKKLNAVIKMIKNDKDVLAIMLFGSTARRQTNLMSDIDICVFFKNDLKNKYRMGEKRLKYLTDAPDNFDIQIFQLLPLYIRIRVLQEGDLLYCRKIKQLYEIAYKTIQEFNLFKPAYEDYIRVR